MKKTYNYLTDLALENPTLKHQNDKLFGFDVTRSSSNGENAITLFITDTEKESVRKQFSIALSAAISEFLPSGFTSVSSDSENTQNKPSIAPVSVICLGNASLTADSLGALCAPSIVATRHLKTAMPKTFTAIGSREISVLCTGVAGQSGVDALEIAKICTKILKSKLIITIDSLKAACTENLCRAVQITDKITPGSGVGNDRPHISKQAVGVPVISIGVPTVISSKTLISQALNSLSIAPATEVFSNSSLSSCNLLVSPIDCDIKLKHFSSIISDAINLTLIGTFFE